MGTISFSQNKANAEESPECPDPSTTTITSIADRGDATSFYALTGGGFCKGTPDEYGVTVYKMGFCTKNPANPKAVFLLVLLLITVLVLGLMKIQQERRQFFGWRIIRFV